MWKLRMSARYITWARWKIKHVNFCIEKGEFCVVVGASGAAGVVETKITVGPSGPPMTPTYRASFIRRMTSA